MHNKRAVSLSGRPKRVLSGRGKMNSGVVDKFGKKILLAEDHPDVRAMVALALKHAGHVVTLG